MDNYLAHGDASQRNHSNVSTLFKRISFSLLTPVFFLILLSLATFYSIDSALFKQQIFYLFFALVAYFLFLNIDYRALGFFPTYIYIGMVLLLSLLFLIGIEAKGAVRWIEIFGLRLQFSEIIKPFYVIFLASFLSATDSKSLIKFIKALLMLLPIFVLTLKQPDLGNAIIFFSLTIFMLFMYGFPFSYFLGLAVTLLIPFPIFFQMLRGYQRTRLLSFFNAGADPSGSSYNAIQALISIGSGGFFGRGFGQATQSILRFLPERHTDFIFATISESLGFVGGLFLIALYAFLLYRIYAISRLVNDSFSYLVLMGFYFLLVTHIFFNIGMNVGILPIVGITLPFVSYGGSSLLTNFIILGIISSIKFEFKRETSIEIR